MVELQQRRKRAHYYSKALTCLAYMFQQGQAQAILTCPNERRLHYPPSIQNARAVFGHSEHKKKTCYRSSIRSFLQ